MFLRCMNMNIYDMDGNLIKKTYYAVDIYGEIQDKQWLEYEYEAQ